MTMSRFPFILTLAISPGSLIGIAVPGAAQTATAPDARTPSAGKPATTPAAATAPARAPASNSTPASAPASTSTSTPAPATVPDPLDDPWEERKTVARENVEYLEALHKAKQAECREAELRNTFALDLKTDIDRQKRKGIASTYTVQQTEITIAENQSQLEMRRVELKDIEIRLARARRRLKAVERSGSAMESEAEETHAEDRVRALEIKNERLQREIETVRRLVDYMRLNHRFP